MKYIFLFLVCTVLLSCNAKAQNTDDTLLFKVIYEDIQRNIEYAFHLIELDEQSGNRIEYISDSIIDYIKTNRKGNEATYQSAFIADSIAKAFIKYVDSLYKAVLEISASKGNDDIFPHNKLFFENGRGAELKNRINSTRIKLIALLPKDDQQQIKSDLIAKDFNDKQTWESELFEHSPAAAVVTLLEKITNDAFNTNIQVLEFLSQRIAKD